MCSIDLNIFRFPSSFVFMTRVVGFEVLTAVIMMSSIVWDITPDYKAIQPRR
jgi:hypothetical protein